MFLEQLDRSVTCRVIIYLIEEPDNCISYYNLTKDGARHPRTLKMFVRYLLRGFSTDLNETWHGKGPRAGGQPREVGILIFQTVAMEIGKFEIEDGARQPRTFLRTEPGSLGHF